MWQHYRDARRIMQHPDKSQVVLEQRLGDILEYAKAHTGYYSAFEGKALSDFPVVNKNTIRSDYDAFIVGSKDGYVPHHTSGSTGTPFCAYQDKDSFIRRIATIKASNEEFGFHSCKGSRDRFLIRKARVKGHTRVTRVKGQVPDSDQIMLLL